MTDRKTEEAVKFARASLALDGLTPSPEAEAKVRAQLTPTGARHTGRRPGSGHG